MGTPVVFVSYSREDAEWQRKFVKMLKPVVRGRGLHVWSDDRLVVGERWRPQLDEAITSAHAALLLVSDDFLASEFIMEEELPALLRRGAQPVCVLVRDCLWDEEESLAELQWAHDPRRDGAVAHAANPQGQIVRVCKRLIELVSDAAPRAAPTAAPPQTAAVEALPAGARVADLHGVPSLPPGFVEREELAELRAAVLRTPTGRSGSLAGRSGSRGTAGSARRCSPWRWPATTTCGATSPTGSTGSPSASTATSWPPSSSCSNGSAWRPRRSSARRGRRCRCCARR